MFKVNEKKQLVLTAELKTLLKKVQSQGNRDIKYQTDKKTYGVEEKWAYPKKDKIKLLGDCEDYCLYKRKLLQEAGVPSDYMLMTICLSSNGEGHCVLSVITDECDYILCNAHEGLTTPIRMKREGWVFKYRQRGKLNELWDVIQ